MENQANYQKSVFEHQIGKGFYFPVYQNRQYGYKFNVYHGRPLYGAGLGNVLRSSWRFFRFVSITGLPKAGSEAIKDGASFKDVLMQIFKPTVGSLLSATAEQAASRLAAVKPTAAPLPGFSNTYIVTQVGTGSRKQKSLYKTEKNEIKRLSKSRG